MHRASIWSDVEFHRPAAALRSHQSSGAEARLFDVRAPFMSNLVQSNPIWRYYNLCLILRAAGCRCEDQEGGSEIIRSNWKRSVESSSVCGCRWDSATVPVLSLFFVIWQPFRRAEYLAVFQDYKISVPLKSQVNKWKVFAFVSRSESPVSRGRAAGLETMCCGLLFPCLPLGSPSLHCSFFSFKGEGADWTSLFSRAVFLHSLVTFIF